jgi:hypothetical protein
LFLPPPFLPPFPSESLSPSPFPSTFQDDIPSGRELCVMWLQLQSPVCGSQAPSHCASEDALCCASVLPIAAPVLFILFLLDSGLTLDPGSKSTTHSSQHFRLLSAAYCSLRNKLSDHLVLRLNHIRYCMPC